MAFSVSNLYNVYSGPPGFGVYLYKSDTDTRETVMASGYFNNTDDNINLAADDIIFVIGDAGGYSLRVDAVSSGTVTTELGAGSGPFYLSVHLDDVAATTSGWTVSPCDGVISRMWVVIYGTISDDTTFGLELGGTNVTDGASADIVTMESSASAAGDVATGTCDGANTVTEAQAIEITCGGEGSTSVDGEVIIEILPC
jgi:hypothetical protein